MGLPYICPYNVNSIMNPILVACLGLGYFFNLYRGKPLVRPGGVVILSHPTPWAFNPIHHPSYIDFFEEVLADTTDPVEIEKTYEERFATDEWYRHLYRTSYAYHGVHPFYMWYWCAHALDQSGRGDHRRGRHQGGAPDGLQAGLDHARRPGDGRGHGWPGPEHHPVPLPADDDRRCPLGSLPGRPGVVAGTRSRGPPAPGPVPWSGRPRPAPWASTTRPTGPAATAPGWPGWSMTEGVTRPLAHLLAAPKVDGLDRLDRLDEPVIFAANHASHIDTPLLLSVLPERWRHRTVVAAGADYFFDRRWKAAFFAFTINAIPIERLQVNRRSADLAASLLDDGWSLLIFPEGGRSPDGWGQTHRPGAAWLAVRTQRTVVPVYVEGTRQVLPRHGSRVRPATTRVTFGQPLRPEPGMDARVLATRIEAALEVLADEQQTDWWSCPPAGRRRPDTPALTGPAAATWRRSWALE